MTETLAYGTHMRVLGESYLMNTYMAGLDIFLGLDGVFNSVARNMKRILLKSEGNSENQILYLTVLPL